jgi:predicted ATPase
MPDPLIRSLTVKNFLSYGPKGISVDLLPLNVLIGPNASGKSNLLEALSILRATAGDLQGAVREGGGITEYLWKGIGANEGAELWTEIHYPVTPLAAVISHGIGLSQSGTRLEIWHELLRRSSTSSKGALKVEAIYDFDGTDPLLYPSVLNGARVPTPLTDFKLSHSILSQRRDPERYPEITFLSDAFGSIALFQEWNFGKRAPARIAQPTDLPSEFLLPDASNLALVLHDLGQTSGRRDELISFLRRFYEPARFISTKIQGGTIQLFIEEEGGRLIPATRLSDGTLRYLCLLAILCHPSPPPVIGIEEPELGLHPDIMPTIAELLKKASERTQLFVTTHSDALVSALSDVPESILVCESMPQGTTIERLQPERLREWLEDYRLGEIWRMGEIGGNRW